MNEKGIDLKSLRLKIKSAPHAELFWRTDKRINIKSGVLRIGDFKLMVQNDKVQLFNLKKDLSETTDLSTVQPERVQTMLDRRNDLNKSSQPPLWKQLSKEEQKMDKYQYQSYVWLKGSQFFKASVK